MTSRHVPQWPLSWRSVPLWSIFERVKDVGHPDEEMLSVYRDYGVVKKDSRDDNANKTAENRDIYQLVDEGWLIINRMKAWQGSVGISPYRGIVSGHYICFRPRHGENPRFLNWLLRSPFYRIAYLRLSRGVRPNQVEIDNDSLRVLPVHLPPHAIQETIADFLDQEVAKIGSLIVKQESLLLALSEHRSAIVDRALRAGISNSKLRESGYPWLGNIAKTWTVTKLAYIANTLAGYAFPSTEFTEDPDCVRLLRGINVSPGRLDWTDTVRWSGDELKLLPYQLRAEDVVLGMDRPIINSGTRVAKLTESDPPCLLLQRVMRLRPNEKATAAFLSYVLSSSIFRDYIAPEFTGVSVPHMSEAQINHFIAAWPPLEEQKKITEYLDLETAAIDQLATKTRELIEVMRERRAALVSTAVTGQIAVTTCVKGH